MQQASTVSRAIAQAAAKIRQSRYLVFTNGAGLGVDSGLPDFRSKNGFWRAYPLFESMKLRFEEVSTPHWFQDDPELAWGFFGHRLSLYSKAVPHEGYRIMRQLGDEKQREGGGSFVVTSNVDGMWTKAGYEKSLMEIHGTIHESQCLASCGQPRFPTPSVEVGENLRAKAPLPRCPRCQSLARPTVLMFDDGECDSSRYDEQHLEWQRFKRLLDDSTPICVIECGAGHAVPTIRRMSERLCNEFERASLIRVNPVDSEVPANRGAEEKFISLPLGAKDALERIRDELKNSAPSGQKS